MNVATSAGSWRKVADAQRCHACNAEIRTARRSREWEIDLGRCERCGTVAALEAAAVVAADRAAAQVETEWGVYDANMHTDEGVRQEVLAQLRRRIGTDNESPILFDVGAGTGAFLDMARSQGFGIAGNDISRSALDYALEHYGVQLSSADLADQPSQSFDAITMWCVLAHVSDPRAFLDAAFQMLRPGGVLFLRTPRWCALDSLADAGLRASGGRIAKLPDRRLTRGHLRLYGDRGMDQLLHDLGFVDVEVQPVAHTGCTGTEIARRLGGPQRVQRWSAHAVDRLMSAGRGPRNSMFAYARRPLPEERPGGQRGASSL